MPSDVNVVDDESSTREKGIKIIVAEPDEAQAQVEKETALPCWPRQLFDKAKSRPLRRHLLHRGIVLACLSLVALMSFHQSDTYIWKCAEASVSRLDAYKLLTRGELSDDVIDAFVIRLWKKIETTNSYDRKIHVTRPWLAQAFLDGNREMVAKQMKENISQQKFLECERFLIPIVMAMDVDGEFKETAGSRRRRSWSEVETAKSSEVEFRRRWRTEFSTAVVCGGERGLSGGLRWSERRSAVVSEV
ncbi:uncharacterized protein A4U43_C01F20560 [Asparagus officinalis]|uniref:Uncharacterized protein n=1 Tax=Asparagus officinalis TaxID=4686 RepID=A0A5P1FVC3_ASPOF|nr:uncharacterized protein A4U43_C01F20560 [Asparagus officinalis]